MRAASLSLRHGVSPAEVEEAFADPRRIGAEAYSLGGEARRALLGATGEGRVLFVICTRRHGRIRVITARDATVKERRRYWRG